MTEAGARRLLAARAGAPFVNLDDLVHRARLDRREQAALAGADALRVLTGHRHRAHWALAGVEPLLGMFAQGTPAHAADDGVALRTPREGEDIVADYARLGLTLRRHPLALLRGRFRRLATAEGLWQLADGAIAEAVGLVTCRQRPGTASGVIFMTLEDETGVFNVVVWNRVAEKYRRALLGASLLAVRGRIQREGEVLHLVAWRLTDHSRHLGALVAASRDFH